MEGYRVKLVIVGGLLAFGSIAVLVKDIKHQVNGIAASAKILELKSECFVSRLQAAQHKWTRETIDCSAEPELKRAFGSDKNVEVMRDDRAMIKFPLQDGSLFTTEVSQQPYTRSGSLKLGDYLPIIYDPNSPRIARAPLGLLDISVALAVFTFGALGVLFGLKFNVKRKKTSSNELETALIRPLPIDIRTTNNVPVSQPRIILSTAISSRSPRSTFGRR